MKKTCIITGANSGIGLATAKEMARQGYRLILTVRSKEKARATKKAILEETKNAEIETVLLDLGSFKSARNAAKLISAKHKTIDVLVNNAGIFALKYAQTEDGFEKVYAVNFLGPFLFTNLLLPALKRAAKKNGGARVINVSSLAHTISGGLTFDEPLWDETRFGIMKSYSASKVAIIYFTKELARRFKKDKIIAHAFNPGIVQTQIVRKENTPKFLFPILSRGMKLIFFFRSPEKVADALSFIATSDEAKKTNGEYWNLKKIGNIKFFPQWKKEAAALWNKSEEYTRMKQKKTAKGTSPRG